MASFPVYFIIPTHLAISDRAGTANRSGELVTEFKESYNLVIPSFHSGDRAGQHACRGRVPKRSHQIEQ